MGRLGTDKNPLVLTVKTEKGATKAMSICEMYDWAAIVKIAPDEPVNLDDLQYKLDSMPIEYEDPKIQRNDPCHCGSGKKFKKCCG